MTDTVDQELEKALGEFRLASARFATASPFDLDNAMDAVDTAKRAVTALFASRTLTVTEARHIAFDCTEEHDCDACATCLRLYHKLRRISGVKLDG